MTVVSLSDSFYSFRPKTVESGYILFKGGLMGSFSSGFSMSGGGGIYSLQGRSNGVFSSGFSMSGGRGDIFSSREVKWGL